MKLKATLFFFHFASMATLLFGQKFTVSGYLRDADTGEELLYAAVSVLGSNDGVTTNEYGYYALTLPTGKYTLTSSYVGYQNQVIDVDLTKDVRVDIELLPGAILQEVVVAAPDENSNIRSTEMGSINIDIKDIQLLPVLFGEKDVLKTIQLLPGVSPSSDGNAGFFVRGGDADQNLVLLDEAPIYNASHLLGFFSVFNSDALKGVKLYKGGVPAQYGGRLSSILDIRMKNGNARKWTASGGIGLISSRLTAEGPILDNQGSLMISGRRTYADLLVRAFSNEYDDTALYFYDLNAKANYKIGPKDRLYLSGYFGRDVFRADTRGIDWGNATGTLLWNHIFSDRIFSNTSLIYSDFDYGFAVNNAGTAIELTAGIVNYNFKQDFTWFLNPGNTLQFGINAIFHQFKPGDFSYESNDGEEPNPIFNEDLSIAPQQALETGFYLDNEQRLGSRLALYYGIRFSTFSNVGAHEVRTYNENDEITSRTNYRRGEFYNTYFNVEPRFNLNFIINSRQSLKFSYNRNYQYLHLLSNATAGTPTDIWTPSTPLVKPSSADQFAIGYWLNSKNGSYEYGIEAYHKKLQDLVDYEDGAETFLNPDLEAELVFGQGRAAGIEFLVKKKKGKLSGWVAYTLSKSERQFDAINAGNWFSARQDRTHDVAIVATYKISPRLAFSGAWIYYTGDAVTFPDGKYKVDGSVLTLYSSRNGDRMPDYHRLDLGVSWLLKEASKWNSELNFTLYNVYNRANAFSIDFRENGDTTEAVKTSLFGIVPSVTWNFNFQ